MPKRYALSLSAALLLGFAVLESFSADQILIAPGASWKFHDKGVSLGTAWSAAAFDDSAWSQGNAQLGYGDSDEATVLAFGSSTNRYPTYYFRRTFTVANLSSISALTLRYLRDDGAVIYVNGVEVVRSNMPAGAISYTTLASAAIGNADETTWLQTPLDKSVLVTGTNVIAVEIHQQAVTSSDVSFDLELRATLPPTAPTVTLISPAQSSTTNSTAVVFSANATAPNGLVSATLLVGTAPKTVTFSGPVQIEDAQMTADTPTVPNGTGLSINVDGQTPHAHGLLKVPALIGAGAGQVPGGSTIQSATLRLNCSNAGALMRLYRLNESWVENQASWNERQTGVAWGNLGAEGAVSNAGVATSADCTVAGQRTIDVTSLVQQWSSGAPNHGVVIIDSGTDGIDFDSSESVNSPLLAVVYTSPAQAVETKPLSGTSAGVTFNATLALGQTYSWNVRVADTQGQQSTAAADFSLTVDTASPNAPSLVSPVNGAGGVSIPPTLSVNASDPAGGSLSVNFQLRQPPAAEFTIIALPDTQHYSEAFPAIYTSQTQWIVNQKAARNIVFVTHEGDIVQNVASATEWGRANTSMSLLDGVVPYGMGPGNHDEPTTLYNQYFPYTRYQGLPWYGGHYGSLNDDNFQLFTAGGMDFVIVHIDFCPSAAVLAWADSVFKQYPTRIGMMTTHAYLGLGGVRSTHVCGATQYIWDALAPPNPNLHFMLSGHVHGEARREDIVNGHPVFQMLADYQDLPSGGEGWLRILRFVPADNKVYVQTYSPWLNQYQTDADSQFALDFPMGGAWSSVGTVGALSGSVASITPAGLVSGRQYEWRASVTNGAGKTTTGPTWTFTTATGPNQPPVANGQSVTATQAVPAAITLTGSDPEGGPLTYSVVNGPANGALSGSAPNLTYTSNAGFTGQDSFTFRANDGSLNSNTATVAVTVNAAVPVTVFSANFDTGSESFAYTDNTFRGATQSAYASGVRVASGGFSGGALQVSLGGINNTVINGMSGGWQRTFSLASAATVTLTFRYNLNMGTEYDADEFSQVLASLDGALAGSSPNDYVTQITGNGNGGATQTSGWVLFQVTRALGAGSHTVTLGGYNNKKNNTSEASTILIDTVTLAR